MAMLKVENLSIKYGSIEAVKNVSFEVNEGEVVTLIGANGAGKSTLMAVLCGTHDHYEGEISIKAGDVAVAIFVCKGIFALTVIIFKGKATKVANDIYNAIPAMGSGVYIKVNSFLDALAEWFDKHISACKTCYHEQTCSCVEQGCVAVKR